MQINPILDRVSAVLVGHFNPAIFSPAWFALNELVSNEDAVRSTVQLIHPEMCQFEVGQFNISCDLQRFIVSCPRYQHEMIRDLIIGQFGQILTHTPIKALGINRDVHFDTGDFRVRNGVGELLAPKAAWGAWAPALTNQGKDPLRASGLTSITMKEFQAGKIGVSTQATVQPSMLHQLGQTGIYVGINNHIDFASDWKGSDVDQLVSILDGEWSPAIDKSEFIIEQIQSLVETCRLNIGNS